MTKLRGDQAKADRNVGLAGADARLETGVFGMYSACSLGWERD